MSDKGPSDGADGKVRGADRAIPALDL